MAHRCRRRGIRGAGIHRLHTFCAVKTRVPLPHAHAHSTQHTGLTALCKLRSSVGARGSATLLALQLCTSMAAKRHMGLPADVTARLTMEHLPDRLGFDRPHHLGFEFIHIPKCGSSFILMLRNALPACKEKDCVCPKFSTLPCNSTDSASCSGHLRACGGSWAGWPSWHAPHGLLPRQNMAVVTLVREPISLATSLIMHHLTATNAAKHSQFIQTLLSEVRAAKSVEAAVPWYAACLRNKASVGSPKRDKFVVLKLNGSWSSHAQVCPNHFIPNIMSWFLLSHRATDRRAENSSIVLAAMPTTAFVSLASRVADVELAFFGLTGDWELSMCLFRRQVLGLLPSAQPAQSDVQNVLPGDHSVSRTLSEAAVAAIEEHNQRDLLLYKQVLLPRWRRNIVKYGCAAG